MSLASISSAESPPAGPVSVGLKGGIVLPQIATELQTSAGIELEAGYALPPIDRRLALWFAAGYQQPAVTRTGVSDPRVGDGSYDGSQVQKELTFGLGALFRFVPHGSLWNGYAALGARLYLLETTTEGSAAGEEFAENREKSTRFGGVVALGGERILWRGALLLEAQFASSDLPHTITGDMSTGEIAIELGYRLFF